MILMLKSCSPHTFGKTEAHKNPVKPQMAHVPARLRHHEGAVSVRSIQDQVRIDNDRKASRLCVCFVCPQAHIHTLVRMNVIFIPSYFSLHNGCNTSCHFYDTAFVSYYAQYNKLSMKKMRILVPWWQKPLIEVRGNNEKLEAIYYLLKYIGVAWWCDNETRAVRQKP